LNLALGVQIVRDVLSSSLSSTESSAKNVADVDRQEHGHLRARGIQELFLELEEIAVQVDQLLS
jgi:hypothetical protein